MCPRAIALLWPLLAAGVLAAGAPPETRKPGRIRKGEIPLVRFFEFLSVNRGIPVIFDATELGRPSAGRTISIVNDTVATYEVVKAILEINGFRVTENVLPDGSTVITVGLRTPPATGSMPIIDLHRKDKTVTRVYRPDQMATIVVGVKHGLAKEVVSAIRSLFGNSRRSGVYVSAVPGGSSVVVTGERKLLEYARDVARHLQHATNPNQIVELIDLPDGVDATAVAAVLSDAVAEASKKPIKATGSRGDGTKKNRTAIVPAVRTRRLLVVTSIREELKLVQAILADTPPDPTTPAGIRPPHIYRVVHGSASAMAATVRQRLTEIAARRGGSQGSEASQSTHSASDPRARERGKATAPSRPSPPRPPRLIPYAPTQTVLIQAEPKALKKIIRLLKDIDRQPAPEPGPATQA